jgi:hypothetical protein
LRNGELDCEQRTSDISAVKIPFILVLIVAILCGCKTATRLSIKPEEANYHFTVRHELDQPEAFNNVELALAESYNDISRVLKLKQAETGTFLLKPLVSYQAGGALGPVQHARYTLKIVVRQNAITLDFELSPEESAGTWAPESEIPKIRADFQAVASSSGR